MHNHLSHGAYIIVVLMIVGSDDVDFYGYHNLWFCHLYLMKGRGEGGRGLGCGQGWS